MITRIVASQNLSKYVGKDLQTLAEKHGVTVIGESGNINKGWKGLTIECLAGLSPNNKKAPNGLGFELKSVCYQQKNGLWKPKETMAITMVNQDDLLNNDFFHSHLWQKMKSLLFCMVSWNGKHNTDSVLLNVITFDFLEDDKLILAVKADYDFIRNKLKTQGFGALTSRDGKYIQARTKGAGHGSKTRAFYAKKCFLEEIYVPKVKALQVAA